MCIWANNFLKDFEILLTKVIHSSKENMLARNEQNH